MMNEQTPSFSCPICSKVVKIEDVHLDGCAVSSFRSRSLVETHILSCRRYFQDILNTCPSHIDSVTVEPDGTWRSSDDKHGTGKPRSTVPSRANSVKPDLSSLDRFANGDGNGKGKGKARADQESLTIDSDDDEDDDEPLAKRVKVDDSGGGSISLGSSPMPQGGVSQKKKKMETIDLTLSDSDEEDEGEGDRRTYVAAPTPRSSSVAGGSGSVGGGQIGLATASGSTAGRLDATKSLLGRLAEDLTRMQDELGRKRSRDEGEPPLTFFVAGSVVADGGSFFLSSAES